MRPSPARCSGEGRITSSPTRRGPNLRFDAELTELDCEGRTSARLWPVRLYVPASSAPPLERGSAVFVIADLAPTSDFRNADLTNANLADANLIRVIFNNTIGTHGQVVGGQNAALKKKAKRPWWQVWG